MTRITRRIAWIALSVVAGAASSAGEEASPLAARLASEDRAAEDRARDAGRRPADVIAFLGIEPGMTVLDLIAAGGYYTEVLSIAVGPGGKVYAQNNDFVLKMRDGANDKAMTARLAAGRLKNVERLDREVAELGLAPDSVDAAITALNFHDIYNGRGPDAASAFLAAVYAVLKPGGVLGIVDHSGRPDANNEELHRIEETKAQAVVEPSGFLLEAKSDVLRNPEDDRSRYVFAEGLRGRTDRFVWRLRKPD
jgi:predicted methyltransferase